MRKSDFEVYKEVECDGVVVKYHKRKKPPAPPSTPCAPGSERVLPFSEVRRGHLEDLGKPIDHAVYWLQPKRVWPRKLLWKRMKRAWRRLSFWFEKHEAFPRTRKRARLSMMHVYWKNGYQRITEEVPPPMPRLPPSNRKFPI